MDRSFYLDLAATGKRLPVATHLVLHEQPDPEAVLLDGTRLAKVLVDCARRFDSPLALPIMDLTLEKDIMLRTLGVPAGDIPTFHFDALPAADAAARLAAMDVLSSPRIRANCDALRVINQAHTKGAAEVPVGMAIGPFSLLTKMLKDPITPIFIAGTGVGPDDGDDDVALLYALLDLCERTVAACCLAQIKAGVKAIFLCEPAANLVYFSPNQIREGSTVYDEFVTAPNRRVKELFNAHGVDLIFHDCGSLIPEMVQSFAGLDAAIISFGSPVKLWEVEPFVPKTTVLYGNLPTKKFYSDEEVPLDGIPAMVKEIEDKLRATGHPFIVGSECDVLAMQGYEKKIMEKLEKFVHC